MNYEINTFGFTSFGVSVHVHTESAGDSLRLKNRLSELFKQNIEDSAETEPDFQFAIKRTADEVGLFKNGEHVVSGKANDQFMNFAETRIRLAVAEHAVRHVFVHAGVVSYRGRGIVIPGMSHSGKTTLVKFLLERGAEYLSDEYAVVNENGMLVPFPKPLSIREDETDSLQTNRRVEDLGGTIAEGPVIPTLVLFTSFNRGAAWKPERLTGGSGVLKLLEHTLPIRKSPRLSLSVLNRLADNAVFYESFRPEASNSAKKVIDLLETHLT